MRIALSKFFYLGFVVIFCSAPSWALAPSPPEPPQGTAPPGMPIDNSIIVLMVVAIIYASFIIYRKKNKNGKNSLIGD